MDTDHLILGAGCAGLSLAMRLGERSGRGRVMILDPRPELVTHDRTWCGWFRPGHRFSDCVSHQWSRWSIVTERATIVRGLSQRPYQHIPGARFFERAGSVLERARDVQLELGTSAVSIEPGPHSVRVETDRGALRARVVWDARGAGRGSNGAAHDIEWSQHFLGWFVRTERAIFDPGIATLMDMRVEQDRGVHFIYVLPFERDRALVEDTYFGEPFDGREASYEATLRSYLDREGAGGFEIERTERGMIPMSTAPEPPRAHPRVVPIGLRGGAAKPSTGYAFAFIQRHVERLSQYSDGSPPPELPVRDARAMFFDRVFLAYLRRYTERGPEVFTRLFERVDPEILVRFLSEEGTLRDHLEVMRAMPPISTTIEVARSSPIWLRAR